MKHTRPLILTTLLLVPLAALDAAESQPADKPNITRADVVIYGATPGGITAAIAADRTGASVVLLEHGTRIGGMMASGLGHTDVGDKRTIGGLAGEVFKRIGAKYGGGQTFHFQPHVGSAVFHEMLAETKVRLLTGRTLKSVTKDGTRLTAFECTDGSRFEAGAFVDATYEGDLMAKAGVRYIVGRESREAYKESLAGIQGVHQLDKLLDSPEVVKQFHPWLGESSLMKPTVAYYKGRRNYLNTHQWPMAVNGKGADGKPLPGITAEPLGTPGAADHRFMAYNYRLCLTRDPANKVPITKPGGYDPAYFELLARYIEKWPDVTLKRLFHVPELPNQTTDLNTSGPYSTDLLDGSAWAYPEADWPERERIAAHHRQFIQGMLWFLGNDPRVPTALREETLLWGLDRSEFADNDHWPWQLYVRVARRMIGEHVMTQKDVLDHKLKDDSVAMGSFIMDSHNIRRVLTPDGFVLNEGGIEVPTKGPYEIGYRSLVPKAEQCSNLLVPVCMSASYIAYCSIRMEPVYMMMGQASGAAAALIARSGRPVQSLPYDELKTTLAAQGQTVLKLPPPTPAPAKR
ncbi:MAG: FAD-dependent oxidoreductase [Lentisphaerae bacterium]|nr:FAD-dependent oxidoreductase [Lentisphaerota bacterium]